MLRKMKIVVIFFCLPHDIIVRILKTEATSIKPLCRSTSVKVFNKFLLVLNAEIILIKYFSWKNSQNHSSTKCVDLAFLLLKMGKGKESLMNDLFTKIRAELRESNDKKWEALPGVTTARRHFHPRLKETKAGAVPRAVVRAEDPGQELWSSAQAQRRAAPTPRRPQGRLGPDNWNLDFSFLPPSDLPMLPRDWT